jgi:hypothetical membrane protein
MAFSNASKAGVALFVGAVQFGISMVIAEIYYSGYGPLGVQASGNSTGYAYSVYNNYISDLGALCRSSCTAVPSAYLFDTSIVILGLLILVSAYFLQRAYRWKPAAIIIAIGGIGAIGVGLFPETTGIWHHVFSLITFLFTGLAALVTARFQRKPMFYFSIILGVVTLAALFLYIGSEYAGLGPGGMERMIVYPVLLWSIGFGGHLMATDEMPKA